jgi:hypothetical protein
MFSFLFRILGVCSSQRVDCERQGSAVSRQSPFSPRFFMWFGGTDHGLRVLPVHRGLAPADPAISIRSTMRSLPVDTIATVMAMRTARWQTSWLPVSISETLTQAQLGIPFHGIIAVSTPRLPCTGPVRVARPRSEPPRFLTTSQPRHRTDRTRPGGPLETLAKWRKTSLSKMRCQLGRRGYAALISMT